MRYRRSVPAWFVLVAVIATASVAAFLTFVPDFQLSLTYNPLTIQAGRSNATGVRVDSVRSFSGIVSLEFTSPEGLSLGWITGDDKISLGKTGTSGLSVRGGAVGNYNVIVTASSGLRSHSARLSVLVQNLTMTSSVSSFTIARGSSGTAEVNLASVNGLEGDLILRAEALRPDGYGNFQYLDPTVNATITPGTTSIEGGGTLSVVLTVAPGQSSSAGEKRVIVYVGRGPSWTFTMLIPLTVV